MEEEGKLYSNEVLRASRKEIKGREDFGLNFFSSSKIFEKEEIVLVFSFW